MKKMNLKKTLQYLPEIILLAGGILCLIGELTGTHKASKVIVIGILALILSVILLLAWKNKYFALYLSIPTGLASFYFILALLSEFREFPAGNEDGLKMLLAGGLLFGGLLVISIIMPIKYFNANKFGLSNS